MIEVEERDGITVLRIANGKANVMDVELCELLTARLRELGRCSTHPIVVTGAGTMFSAGVDLVRLLDGGVPYIRRFLPALGGMLAAVFSHPTPVVAAINGHAIAGGCVLACAADRRIMGQGSARIGVTELLVGVTFPTVAMEIMRSVLSPRYFEEAILSGTTYSPAEAAERGLVNELAEPGSVLDRAIGCASSLAALAPAAFAFSKRQMRQPALQRSEHDAAAERVEQIWTAPETLERVRDYVRRTLRKS
jgi:enoyl-CoA hydratase